MKRIIKLSACLVLLAVTGVIGKLTGCFEDGLLAGLHFDGQALLTAIVSVLALIIISELLSLILNAIKPKAHSARTLLTVIASVLRYVFALIAICSVLAAFGADIRTVVTGLGILALIIGFGAESLIADLITGLFALMESQYNVGDIIEVDGFHGTITNIGIRTTCITDLGGNILIVNNANMKNVLNRSNRNSKSVCVFPIPYEADLRKLEEQIPALLERIYQAHSDIMAQSPQYLGVDALADSSVNLKFVVEVEESNIYSAARVLNHDLYLGMQELGIEVPFPQVDVHNR